MIRREDEEDMQGITSRDILVIEYGFRKMEFHQDGTPIKSGSRDLTESTYEDEEQTLNGDYEGPSETIDASDSRPDDASDYYPSDGEGEHPALSFRGVASKKYVDRAKRALLAMKKVHYEHKHLTPNEGVWVAEFRRYNFDEHRWVNKGPVFLYFLDEGNHRQLVANYIYGTMSIAINLSVYEFLGRYFARISPKRFVFSTCGYNIIKQVDIIPEKVTLGHYFNGLYPDVASLPVFHCSNEVRAVQEQFGSVMSLHFLDSHYAEQFQQELEKRVLQVQQFRWLERVQSFHGTYVQSPDGEVGPPHMCSFSGDQEFVQQLAQVGLSSCPMAAEPNNPERVVIEGVRCTWCKAAFGPVRPGIDNVVALHQHQPQAQHCRCPFAFQ